ncbi:putative ctr copper transporter family protein [Lasiodiplodia theobromae]|uniref:CTR copper transporter protein n=1 Tax=Lasiodiplodia theobromae TaxID=45133 RepID=UPI0015C3E5AC|nr:CTR copper transporter protein [Lasiodiplodia theobromae]KAF4535184.1 CTR copper transporter protein [Lasiodiplodia theobromae]KAF9633748.1 putative ctr copper transporter family protein [Lasiodiplodia theobromae]
MDHGHMDHGHMDHGDMGHGGHGDMDMGGGPKCNMNMLFTWDTTDLCIVFRSWHVGSTWSLIVSLLGVVVLCAGYELVRELSRRYEASVAARQSGVRVGGSGVPDPRTHSIIDEDNNNHFDESSSLLGSTTANNAGGRTVVAWSAREEKRIKIVKAVLYAVQVFYSFFIMLLFMTYNGWVMLAVAVGAFAGYLAFGNAGGAGGSATKSVACH